MTNKIFSCALAFAAATILAAAEPLANCDLSQTPAVGTKTAGNLEITHNAAAQEYIFAREPHTGKMASGSVVVPLKALPGMALLQGECSAVICNKSPRGNTQVSGKLQFDIYSSANKAAAGFILSSERYHNSRKIEFIGAGKPQQLPFNFVPDQAMKLLITVNLAEKSWAGTIQADGKLLFTTGQQKLAENFKPDYMRIIATTNSRNDGLQIKLSKVAVNGMNGEEAAAADIK